MFLIQIHRNVHLVHLYNDKNMWITLSYRNISLTENLFGVILEWDSDDRNIHRNVHINVLINVHINVY